MVPTWRDACYEDPLLTPSRTALPPAYAARWRCTSPRTRRTRETAGSSLWGPACWWVTGHSGRCTQLHNSQVSNYAGPDTSMGSSIHMPHLVYYALVALVPDTSAVAVHPIYNTLLVGCVPQRGDIASGEGLEMVQGLGQGGSTTRRSLVSRGGVTRRGGFNGTLEADGSDTEDGARFFDDDDVLLSEMREDAERRAHLHSAGGLGDTAPCCMDAVLVRDGVTRSRTQGAMRCRRSGRACGSRPALSPSLSSSPPILPRRSPSCREEISVQRQTPWLNGTLPVP